jgi:hypothetical protein
MKSEFPIETFNRDLRAFTAACAAKDGTEARSRMLSMNAFTHSGSLVRGGKGTLEDSIWESGDDRRLRSMEGRSMYSAAWHLWHCARIEDVCLHAFVSGGEQVLDSEGYRRSLGTRRIDTGNSFDAEDMERFNESIDLEALREYRLRVGRESRAAMKKLGAEELARKVDPAALAFLAKNGYVDAASSWLLDFWGKKRISGIVAMPLTRHILVHLNAARRRLKP